MPFDCFYCKKTFCWSGHLRRHERGCKSAPTQNLIQCAKCKYATSRSDALKQHEKTHEDKTYDAKTHEADGGETNRGKRKCPVCHAEFCGTPIEPHFRAEHGIHMKWQNLEFAEFEGFKTWLRNLEEVDGVHFIKRCFKGRKDGSKKIIFSCFRNGFYHSRAKIRNQKLLGSNKINGYCPAKITINILADGSVRGEYQQVHVGHGIHEIGRLRLSQAEREDFAGKISLQIPIEHILNGVQNNIGDNMRRRDIVSRKDLLNIAQRFNLSTSIPDHISIELFVKDNIKNILLYEPREENFMLGIMTPAQKVMLGKFGSEHISIDSTHGFKYNFQMTTVMVLDDLHQGFPIAILISKRVCLETLVPFLAAVKERMGKPVRTGVFMSDMADELYNAWIAVMGPAKKRLFCAWHVLRAWEKNLGKITGADKKTTVHNTLHQIMQEPSKECFKVKLAEIMNVWKSDKDTARFAEYFSKEYLGKEPLWAYCYRTQAGVNTNMHLERMHGIIKHRYFKGKQLQRLDSALRAVMQFLRDKLHQNVITANRGKLTNRMSVARQRHKTSHHMQRLVFQMSQNTWQLSAATKTSKCYEVKLKQMTSCCNTNCPECKVCIHQFECNCIDASVRFNICKHIHYVKRKIDNKEVIAQEAYAENIISNNAITLDNGDELFAIKELQAKPISREDLAKRKKKFIEKCLAMMDQIDSHEDLDILVKNVKHAQNTIEARTAANFNILGNEEKNKSKNAEKQRRFAKK